MEDLLQQGGHEAFKDSDKLLSRLQMQSACLNSLDKALEAVTDLSIALACNLQLARRDSILEVCASHLQEHDFNKLRRTGFKSADLFFPTTLDQIQKKQDRSPKRHKVEQRPSFQSNSRSEDRPLLALTVLAPIFFVANRTSSTSSPTSHLQDVVVVDTSDNQNSVLHGGRLQFYWQVWLHLHCHPRVVQILRFGYQIIPHSNPPKSVLPTIHSGYSKPQKHCFLTDCVSEMLKKGAIYPLKVCTAPGFCSRLFLVPKPRKNGVL